ncbi:hypothetical protein FE257_003528 [Aspergillus nanangensis]|uniref:N-acetyltransferase domain-containing protein n=1 Tax=Aspergillus nanangensis TaxID=2582783 RepID=A0AAD4GNH8_ASPNN|nr:hypothetical protein FE257_003528 [Aspergillus nanangensis]
MPSSNTFTTTLLPPPNKPLTRPTPTTPTPPTNPQAFNDAFTVRTKVFVDEQSCSLDEELDADDPRSWHWVIYDDTKPIATIRLVPPPHAPHAAFADPAQATTLPRYDLQAEPCVRITRVAVLTEYRGNGLGRELVEAALGWAATHGDEIQEAYERVIREEEEEGKKKKMMMMGEKEGEGRGSEMGELRRWTGLALAHAQVSVEKMYVRMGFRTDEPLGRWMEEGIEHVGMWRCVQVCG